MCATLAEKGSMHIVTINLLEQKHQRWYLVMDSHQQPSERTESSGINTPSPRHCELYLWHNSVVHVKCIFDTFQIDISRSKKTNLQRKDDIFAKLHAYFAHTVCIWIPVVEVPY
jgi:hypothetical protein